MRYPGFRRGGTRALTGRHRVRSHGTGRAPGLPALAALAALPAPAVLTTLTAPGRRRERFRRAARAAGAPPRCHGGLPSPGPVRAGRTAAAIPFVLVIADRYGGRRRTPTPVPAVPEGAHT